MKSRRATYQSRLSPPTLLSGLIGKVSKSAKIHQKSWSGGNGSELRFVTMLCLSGFDNGHLSTTATRDF